jgi:uncharacterized protein YecE (DUF72 family)
MPQPLTCPMQNSLFGNPEDAARLAARPGPRKASATTVGAQPVDPALRELAAALPSSLRLGTSSWTFPGWAGLVWDGDYADAKLSKYGLAAYAQHPLLRTVSLDRAFYRPLTVDEYHGYAVQVPDDFRFVVKAPSLIADALVRSEDGRGLQDNPGFLDPELAVRAFVQPALDGLGHKLGALVFQLSPMPASMLARPTEMLQRLRRLLQALPDIRAQAPDGVIAVELRDPLFLTRGLALQLIDVLRECRATYCLGLHAKMPPIAEQLPILRALWPGPLVCRWNLHLKHGAYGYEEAKRLYGAFDRIVDADPETRQSLARVISGTTAAGYPAYVTIGNKAEGSAPLSVIELATVVARLRDDYQVGKREPGE